MRNFRKVIFWCHLLTGVTAGIVILIMSVTGVLLTYEKQITSWADMRGYRNLPVPGDQTERLSPEQLLKAFRERDATATVQTLIVRSSLDLPSSVVVAGNGARTSARTLYLNPYSGEVLGEGSTSVRRFFRVVTDWHRWLGASNENRTVARAVTGACNLGFLFIVTSGIFIWWPKNWSRSQLRKITWFRRNLPGKAREFNWHNTIGFWSLIPLFIVVLSATVISYPWASNLVYRLVGETAPQPSTNRPRSGSETQLISESGLDPLFARASSQVSDWKTLSARIPTSPDAPVAFSIDSGGGGQPQKRSSLTLDRKTGEVLKWEPFSSYSTGRKLRTILRFAHTGEVLGIGGQTIAGLASLGGAFLVYTGISLSIRRFVSWQERRRRSQIEVPGKAEGASA